MSAYLESDEMADERDDAVVAADFASQFLISTHRGVIDCGDKFVLFGNDGYSIDSRSVREVEIVMETLAKHSPVFGLCREGCTWAIVVTDYGRTKFNAAALERMVWDAWFVACEEANHQADASV